MSTKQIIADRAMITDAGAMFTTDGFSIAMVPSRHPDHGEHFAIFYTNASFSSVSRVVMPDAGLPHMAYLLEVAATGDKDARGAIGSIIYDALQNIGQSRQGVAQ